LLYILFFKQFVSMCLSRLTQIKLVYSSILVCLDFVAHSSKVYFIQVIQTSGQNSSVSSRCWC